MTADRDADGTRFSDELLTLPGAAPWLPDAVGTYEEGRLAALLADLRTEARPDSDAVFAGGSGASTRC